MAEQVKALFHPEAAKAPKKDKLAETKRVERERKDMLKQIRQDEKENTHEEHLLESEAYRLERSWNPVVSKRAAREARVAAKHEHKQQAGEMCEHGVWKCRICFPHHAANVPSARAH